MKNRLKNKAANKQMATLNREMCDQNNNGSLKGSTSLKKK
jgi:hypothetical protein